MGISVLLLCVPPPTERHKQEGAVLGCFGEHMRMPWTRSKNAKQCYVQDALIEIILNLTARWAYDHASVLSVQCPSSEIYNICHKVPEVPMGQHGKSIFSSSYLLHPNYFFKCVQSGRGIATKQRECWIYLQKSLLSCSWWRSVALMIIVSVSKVEATISQHFLQNFALACCM